MSTNEHLTSLRATLQNLSGACDLLHATLTAEKQAISSRDLTALARCGEEKQAQLQEVESLETQRTKLIESLGWNERERYPNEQLAQAWQEVLTRLQACQDANEVNGAILRNQQQQIQKTLDIVAGKDAPSSTYQADGTATHRANNSPIAKA